MNSRRFLAAALAALIAVAATPSGWWVASAT
jgi:hypothetical protein